MTETPPSEIYYAGTTFIDPAPLDSKLVQASVGATVGPDPAEADEPEDVSIVVPAGACQCDVRITITKILNPQAMPVQCLGSYDFGPSGVEFSEPVTVTIPYRYTAGDKVRQTVLVRLADRSPEPARHYGHPEPGHFGRPLRPAIQDDPLYALLPRRR